MSSIVVFFSTAKLEGFIIHSACNDFNIVPVGCFLSNQYYFLCHDFYRI